MPRQGWNRRDRCQGISWRTQLTRLWSARSLLIAEASISDTHLKSTHCHCGTGLFIKPRDKEPDLSHAWSSPSRKPWVTEVTDHFRDSTLSFLIPALMFYMCHLWTHSPLGIPSLDSKKGGAQGHAPSFSLWPHCGLLGVSSTFQNLWEKNLLPQSSPMVAAEMGLETVRTMRSGWAPTLVLIGEMSAGARCRYYGPRWVPQAETNKELLNWPDIKEKGDYSPILIKPSYQENSNSFEIKRRRK